MKKKYLFVMLLFLMGVCVCPKGTKAATVPILKVRSATANQVTLTWNLPKGSRIVRLQQSSQSSKGFKTTKKLSDKTNKLTIKRLSEKKTYYYRITCKDAMGKTVLSNVIAKWKVKGNYSGKTYGSNLTVSQKKYVKNKVAHIVNVMIKPGMNAFHKALALHDYICKHYDEDFLNAKYAQQGGSTYAKYKTNTAYGIMKFGYGACSGYCRLYKALCDAAGVPCKHINASKWTHQYNKIKCNGKWYNVDVELNDHWNAFKKSKPISYFRSSRYIIQYMEFPQLYELKLTKDEKKYDSFKYRFGCGTLRGNSSYGKDGPRLNHEKCVPGKACTKE